MKKVKVPCKVFKDKKPLISSEERPIIITDSEGDEHTYFVSDTIIEKLSSHSNSKNWSDGLVEMQIKEENGSLIRAWFEEGKELFHSKKCDNMVTLSRNQL